MYHTSNYDYQTNLFFTFVLCFYKNDRYLLSKNLARVLRGHNILITLKHKCLAFCFAQSYIHRHIIYIYIHIYECVIIKLLVIDNAVHNKCIMHCIVLVRYHWFYQFVTQFCICLFFKFVSSGSTTLYQSNCNNNLIVLQFPILCPISILYISMDRTDIREKTATTMELI